MPLSSVKQQENNLQREGDREAGQGGSRGRWGKRKFAPDFYRKKTVTLILLWPLVVLVTVQQLDVDKIANENSYSNSQLAAYADTGLWTTCPHPHYPTVSDDMSH